MIVIIRRVHNFKVVMHAFLCVQGDSLGASDQKDAAWYPVARSIPCGASPNLIDFDPRRCWSAY